MTSYFIIGVDAPLIGRQQEYEKTQCKKRLKDEYKDPDMLPKVNKADMAGTMESIKEYFR